jgi:hypothetical protein
MAAAELMTQLGASSKLNAERSFWRICAIAAELYAEIGLRRPFSISENAPGSTSSRVILEPARPPPHS